MLEHTRLRLIQWGTRLAWGAAAVVGVLVAIRIAWGWEATSRWEAARELVARQKFELDPRKLLPAPIPDKENAAVAVLEAFRLENVEVPDPSRRGDGRFLGYGRMFGLMSAQRVEEQMAKNREALGWLDRAATMPRSEWEVNENGLRRELNEEEIYSAAFDLQMLLRWAAELKHMRGEDDEAIGYLERLLTLARVVGTQQSLTSKQFASNIKSEAALSADRVEPELKWTPATTAALHRFTGELMGSAAGTEDMRRAFEYETATYGELVMEKYPSLGDWWIRPLAVDSFARRLAMQSQLLPAVEGKDWQEVSSVTIERTTDGSNLGNIVLSISLPRYMAVDAMRSRFHAMSDARGVATLLASELYKREKGKYPESLTELVPEYLAEVPADPFARDGRALRYRLDAGGPTVWSVGENGEDEEGKVNMTGSPMYPNARRFNQPDIVYGAAWRAATTTMPAR